MHKNVIAFGSNYWLVHNFQQNFHLEFLRQICTHWIGTPHLGSLMFIWTRIVWVEDKYTDHSVTTMDQEAILPVLKAQIRVISLLVNYALWFVKTSHMICNIILLNFISEKSIFLNGPSRPIFRLFSSFSNKN